MVRWIRRRSRVLSRSFGAVAVVAVIGLIGSGALNDSARPLKHQAPCWVLRQGAAAFEADYPDVPHEQVWGEVDEVCRQQRER